MIFLVVANNKIIHATTSKDCYFYQLKFFKNFNYRYYLLTIYTGQQQFISIAVTASFNSSLITTCPSKFNRYVLRKIINRQKSNNHFLIFQDGANAGFWSLQTAIVIKLSKAREWTLERQVNNAPEVAWIQ